MLEFSHPVLAWIVHYWPSVVLLPTILLGVVLLATVSHFWDQRDDEARRAPRPSLEP